MRPPLSRRGKEAEAAEWEGPFDGVPEWMRSSLVSWVTANLPATTIGGRKYPHSESLRRIERALHISLSWTGAGEAARAQTAFNYLVVSACTDSVVFLDLVDFMLGSFGADPASLESILAESGSAWSVVRGASGVPELQQRVDPTVVAIVEASSASARVGSHLREAWSRVYGRHPDPSGAYREAVRAVEAAAIPVVVPNDKSATLGKVIGVLRNNPSGWKTVMNPKGGGTGVAEVVSSLDLLWTAQLDRHGTADETVPLSVSPAEAETAVHLAALLCHMFGSGAVSAA